MNVIAIEDAEDVVLVIMERLGHEVIEASTITTATGDIIAEAGP